MDKKLADYLYTARWAIKANKADVAYNEVTNALAHIGAIKESIEADVEREDKPVVIQDIPDIWEPTFVVVKGVKFKDNGRYQTESGKFEGIVAHYTVSGRTASSAIGVLKYLASQNLGCMVMDEDGKIYIPEGFDIFTDWCSHAGVSKWGKRTSVSRYFAGMEICNWGKGSKVGPFRESKGEANIQKGIYQQYTPKQESEFKNFCLWAYTRNETLNLQNVVGHDELRIEAGKPGDKSDPGASLSLTMPKFREVLINTAIQLRL